MSNLTCQIGSGSLVKSILSLTSNSCFILLGDFTCPLLPLLQVHPNILLMPQVVGDRSIHIASLQRRVLETISSAVAA
jgi:hypothetical protein